jgi:nucleoside 2-deoxyribosyltransferase
MNGVRKSDIVIVLLPGGRGTHVELGAALALEKRVYIWAETDELFLYDERTCVFYWNSRVTRIVGDIYGLIQELNPGGMGVDYA